MKYLPVYIGSLVVTLIGTYLGVVIALKAPVTQPVATPLGGGAAGLGNCTATTTDTFGPVVVGQTKLLKAGSGVLCAVVITTSTAGSFNIYDATTSDATKRTRAATTTLAKIGASASTGDIQFNVPFSTGLLLEFQSTNLASSTITSQ